MFFTAANIVSLSRIVLGIVFMFAATPFQQALIIGVSALSDFLDGFLARHFDQRSRFGEILDPVTDKLFVAAVLGTMLVRGRMSIGTVLLFLVRDFYNALAFVVIQVRKLPIRMKARFSGKTVTVMQMLTLAAFVLWPSAAWPLLLATVGVSIYSIFDYTRAGRRGLREARSAP